MGIFGFLKKKPDPPRQKPAAGEEITQTEKPAAQAEGTLVPGVGRIPFPAYKGSEPYIFISYAHADAGLVFPIIRQFYDQGYHVWYDEGIAAGNEWTDEIANALEGCSLFLVFMTPNSEKSPNCRDEIGYAIDEKKPFLAIHLKETTITGGLKLRIGAKQAILKYNMSDEEFEYKYTFGFENLGLPVPDFIKANRKKNALSREKTQNIAAGDSGGKAVASKRAQTAAAKGTAQITTVKGKVYSNVPAGSIYSRIGNNLVAGIGFTLDDKKLPKIQELSRYKAELYGDNNPYHKQVIMSQLRGADFTGDIQTAKSDIVFLDAGKKVLLGWSEIAEISFDWKKDCLENWPGYARIHKTDGELVYVPQYSLNIGTQKKPSENQISFDRRYQWTDKIRTERGTDVSLAEITSIAFGKVSYTEDSWKKDWFRDLPMGILLRDGRQLSTYSAEDWFVFCAMDDFGSVAIPVETISHIDFVDSLQDEVFVPEVPESRPEQPVQQAAEEEEEESGPKEMPDPVQKYGSKKYISGDYIPRGTVEVFLKDGNTITGIANSFLLMAIGMEKRSGGNECLYNNLFLPEEKMDDGQRDSVMISELSSITVGDRRDVTATDLEEETKNYILPEKSWFWFISETSKAEPEKVQVSQVREVRFNWLSTPDIPVRMFMVYTKEGRFQAPAAFLAVKYNEGGGSFPHMKYAHNFNNFSGYPVSPKNTLLIDVTKPGFGGSMFAPPASSELRAFLKNGEVIDFSMGGYFSLGVLGAHGILKELKREMTQCFDFR